jgi:hypothetical protein
MMGNDVTSRRTALWITLGIIGAAALLVLVALFVMSHPS